MLYAKIYRNYHAATTPIMEISNLIANNLDLRELYLENEYKRREGGSPVARGEILKTGCLAPRAEAAPGGGSVGRSREPRRARWLRTSLKWRSEGSMRSKDSEGVGSRDETGLQGEEG